VRRSDADLRHFEKGGFVDALSEPFSNHGYVLLNLRYINKIVGFTKLCNVMIALESPQQNSDALDLAAGFNK
jgi:hypothetical protein